MQFGRLRRGQALGLGRSVDLTTQCRGFSDEAVPFLLQGLLFRLQGGAINSESLQRRFAGVLKRQTPPLPCQGGDRIRRVRNCTVLVLRLQPITEGFSRDTRKNAPQNSNNSFGAMA